MREWPPIYDVPPLPRPLESYRPEMETRKYATRANELVDSNLVITFNFGTKIVTQELLRRRQLAMSQMSSSVTLKLARPKTTCLMFASGKGLIVGVKSVQHGLLAAWQVVRIVIDAGFPRAAVHGLYVRNVTSTTFMGGYVDIMRLEQNPGEFHYGDLENHIFPGIYLKSHDERVHITVAVVISGKINITGARHVSQTEHVINSLIRYIRACLVTDEREKAALKARAQRIRQDRHRRAAELAKRLNAAANDGNSNGPKDGPAAAPAPAPEAPAPREDSGRGDAHVPGAGLPGGV